MKTKNQTEQSLLELAVTKAANEDGINPPVAQPDRKQAWCPKEVWRTRVKPASNFIRPESAPA